MLEHALCEQLRFDPTPPYGECLDFPFLTRGVELELLLARMRYRFEVGQSHFQLATLQQFAGRVRDELLQFGLEPPCEERIDFPSPAHAVELELLLARLTYRFAADQSRSQLIAVQQFVGRVHDELLQSGLEPLCGGRIEIPSLIHVAE